MVSDLHPFHANDPDPDHGYEIFADPDTGFETFAESGQLLSSSKVVFFT